MTAFLAFFVWPFWPSRGLWKLKTTISIPTRRAESNGAIGFELLSLSGTPDVLSKYYLTPSNWAASDMEWWYMWVDITQKISAHYLYVYHGYVALYLCKHLCYGGGWSQKFENS